MGSRPTVAKPFRCITINGTGATKGEWQVVTNYPTHPTKRESLKLFVRVLLSLARYAASMAAQEPKITSGSHLSAEGPVRVSVTIVVKPEPTKELL